MTRDVDCMVCLTTLAKGAEDYGERFWDDNLITHAVFTLGSRDQGYLTCGMTYNKWVGWILKSRRAYRTLTKRGDSWVS